MTENKTTFALLGAAREAFVTFDLLMRGFNVYPIFSFHGPHDLTVYKNNIALRIEVKGESRAPFGGPVTSTGASTRKGAGIDCRKFDVLAVVNEQTRTVRYLRSVLHPVNEVSQELIGTEARSHRINKRYLERAKNMEASR
jgi:hypothetical protein